jgi:hypothetical protein
MLDSKPVAIDRDPTDPARDFTVVTVKGCYEDLPHHETQFLAGGRMILAVIDGTECFLAVVKKDGVGLGVELSPEACEKAADQLRELAAAARSGRQAAGH